MKDAYVFASKVRGTVAGKIRVALEQRDKVKDSSLWPPHVRITLFALPGFQVFSCALKLYV